MLSNSCSVLVNPETGRRCEGQMEFFGISAKKFRLPGWPRAVTVHFRWQQCQTCGQYREETFGGQVVGAVAKFTDKQIEALFPTEERRGNNRNRKAKSTNARPKGGTGAQPAQS